MQILSANAPALTWVNAGRLQHVTPPAMEHRGVEYSLVRTLAPNGWKWSVQHQGKLKSGTASSRAIAIRQAERFIDGLLRKLRKSSGTCE